MKAKELLIAVPWNEMSDVSLQDSCDLFYENINTVIDQTIPEISTTKKKSKPIWMDYYCQKLVDKNIGHEIGIIYSIRREDYLKYCQIRS